MSGFVVMHRAIFNHPLFRRHPERFMAWAWLIANACWKPTRFDINGQTVTLERGQLCVSRSQLANAWNWSDSAVERFLTRLKTEQMIGRETGQGRSIITICNYAKYQDVKQEAGQATGQPIGQRSDSDRTAKEQGNKGTREDTSVSSQDIPQIATFDDFWKAYPRRVGKEAARKAWAAATKRGAKPWHVIEGAQWLAGHPPDDAQFIPYPATWLNQGRYDDERTDDGKQPLGGNRSAPAGQYRRSVGLEMLRDAASEVGFSWGGTAEPDSSA